ncbi:MAG: ribosome silencing factor [Deltaproteobacteria bacterium]|nr:ribosome silencing factor [Deltaproteobacteria bacterium]
MALSLEEKTNLCIKAAIEKQASDIVVLDLKGISAVTDSFLICSGNSTRQVQAIADAIDETMSKRGKEPGGVEGYSQARWVLMDYEDLIVHIFHKDTRHYYDIERLWAKARTTEISVAT